MQVQRKRFNGPGQDSEVKTLLVIESADDARVVADAGLVGWVAGKISGLLRTVPDGSVPVDVTVDPTRVLAEEVGTGEVVVEAAIDGTAADLLTETYRDYPQGQLPVTIGAIASEDVLAGLRLVANTETVATVNNYLTTDVAQKYLAEMGLMASAN